MHLRAPNGISHGTGLYVLTPQRRPHLRDDPLREQRAPWFGLPRSLPTTHL